MIKVNDCEALAVPNSRPAHQIGAIRGRLRFCSGTATQRMRRALRLAGAPLTAAALLSATPAMAQNLGLTVDQLIERLGAAANAAGAPLEFRELNCLENEKPGNPDEKIVSCSYMMGEGRLLISNSEPEGPLIDIATQPWGGGENGPAALMIAWISAAINEGEPAEYGPAANALVNAVASDGNGNASIGKAGFFVLDLGGDLTITAQAQ